MIKIIQRTIKNIEKIVLEKKKSESSRKARMPTQDSYSSKVHGGLNMLQTEI